jgi:hypothetical protein
VQSRDADTSFFLLFNQIRKVAKGSDRVEMYVLAEVDHPETVVKQEDLSIDISNGKFIVLELSDDRNLRIANTEYLCGKGRPLQVKRFQKSSLAGNGFTASRPLNYCLAV